MDIADILTAIGNMGGLIMGFVSLIALLVDRKKRASEIKKTDAEANNEDCDAAQKVSSAAGNLVELYDRRLCELEKKLSDQEAHIRRMEEKQRRLITRFTARIAYLMNGIDQLLHQIVSLRATPEWTPDEWTPEEDEEG